MSATTKLNGKDMNEDTHLEMDYEDRNGSALPEHLMHEESEDIYAGTAANDDPEGMESLADVEYDREADSWMWSDRL